MPVINGVTVYERVHRFSEEFSIQGGPAPFKGYFVPNWSDRYAVVRGVLGLASATSIGGAMTLLAPMRYPEIPTVYARRVSIEPHGRPSQGTYQIQYPSCTVWVEFAAMPWAFTYGDSPFMQLDITNPIIFAEQSLSSSCEWITVPGKSAKFKTSGKRIDQDYGFRLALVEMNISIKQLAYMPTPQILAKSGSINNASYLGVSAGKLLFNGVQTHEGAVSDGTFTLEGNYSFTARTQRWDYAYDGDNDRWDQVVRTDGSTPFLDSLDHSDILPMGYSIAS